MSDPGLASAPGQRARVLDIGPSRKQRRSSSVLRFSVVVRMLVPHPAAWRTLAQRRLCRCRPSSLTMPAKLSINDVDVAGKRVFMRVDFNVPQDRWASAMLLLWVFFLNSSAKVLLLSTVLIVSDSVQFPPCYGHLRPRPSQAHGFCFSVLCHTQLRNVTKHGAKTAARQRRQSASQRWSFVSSATSYDKVERQYQNPNILSQQGLRLVHRTRPTLPRSPTLSALMVPCPPSRRLASTAAKEVDVNCGRS